MVAAAALMAVVMAVAAAALVILAVMVTATALMVVAIMTADAEKDGDWLEAAIRKEEGCADVTIVRSSVGPTIGSHVGPGMVACAFWGKNRADKASLSDRIARRVRGQ